MKKQQSRQEQIIAKLRSQIKEAYDSAYLEGPFSPAELAYALTLLYRQRERAYDVLTFVNRAGIIENYKEANALFMYIDREYDKWAKRLLCRKVK